LKERLERKQAVFAVVAIIGTTEEGAVDPLAKVLKLRKRYQRLGMSFIVHADAAWGGYFASTLPPKRAKDQPHDFPDEGDYVATVPLRKETTKQLLHLHLADSITIDPHKTGYVPYPAGALCYRDNRMKYLVTWTTPYISRDPSAESIGVYGVEGR
jgi:glutamate/tyrosine decarboxylase-like PLP-dependent enzyme